MILPWPDSALLPNNTSGKSWKTTRQVKLSAKKIGYYTAIQHPLDKPKEGGRIPLMIDFYPPDRRHRDLDGMLSSCKAMLDGVADAWGVNDRQFRPVTLDVKEPLKEGRVVITVLNDIK